MMTETYRKRGSISPEQAVWWITDALTSARVFVNMLGSRAWTRDGSVNPSGDTRIVADLQSEESVRDSLTESRDLSFQGLGEELGTYVAGDQPDPWLILTEDGIDGSSIAEETEGRAMNGTMIGLYEGWRFCDFLATGMLVRTWNGSAIVVCGRGLGVHYLVYGANSTRRHPTRCSTVRSLEELRVSHCPVQIDMNFKENRRVLQALHDLGLYRTSHAGSAVTYASSLVLGCSHLVVERSRVLLGKPDLERACDVPMVREAGGITLVGRRCEEVWEQDIRTFCHETLSLEPRQAPLVLHAATRELGLDMMPRLA